MDNERRVAREISGDHRRTTDDGSQPIPSKSPIKIGTELETWLRLQPPPQGDILGGEAGVRLRHDPEVVVGMDVVYVSHDVLLQQTSTTKLIDGIPVLAVEILSPSDTIDNIVEKIRTYLEIGVHRLDSGPTMPNRDCVLARLNRDSSIRTKN
jgi:hypothetical protein